MNFQERSASPGRPASAIGMVHPVSWILGLYMLALAAGLSYAVLRLWPYVAGEIKPSEGAGGGVTIFSIPLIGSVQVIALAMAWGGLGGYVHVARSFIVFVGNGQLTARWFWWYLLWPLLGMILAAVGCLLVLALFAPVGTTAGANPFGIAAISALLGMFAKPVTEKLREVFETLFTVHDPTPLTDRLANSGLNPRPTDVRVEPAEIEPWRGARTVTVKGRGFVEGSEVLIQGAARATEFVGPNELRALLQPEDTVAEGAIELGVRNPPSGGGVSERVTLRIKRKESAGVSSAPAG